MARYLAPYLFLRFSGSAGQAIINRSHAYLIVDSRYWIQAREQVDHNWDVVRAGSMNEPKDWIDWLVVRIPILCPRNELILHARQLARTAEGLKNRD